MVTKINQTYNKFYKMMHHLVDAKKNEKASYVQAANEYLNQLKSDMSPIRVKQWQFEINKYQK